MSDWAQDIRQTQKLSEEMFNSRNYVGMGKLYTDDCILMPPGKPPLRGRQSAIEFYSKLPSTGIDRSAVASEEIIPLGDTAIERGSFVLYKADGSAFGEGKYVVVWKRVDGEPKLYTDIWNSNKA